MVLLSTVARGRNDVNGALARGEDEDEDEDEGEAS